MQSTARYLALATALIATTEATTLARSELINEAIITPHNVTPHNSYNEREIDGRHIHSIKVCGFNTWTKVTNVTGCAIRMHLYRDEGCNELLKSAWMYEF